MIACPRCSAKEWQVPKQWTVCRECGRMFWVTQDGLVGASDPDEMADDRPRYFISIYTDGPATRWNVIDRRTQEWVRRFASQAEAQAHADKLNGA